MGVESDCVQVECLQDEKGAGIQEEGQGGDTRPVGVVQDGTPLVHLQNTMDHGTKDAPCINCRDHDVQSRLGASVPNPKNADHDTHWVSPACKYRPSHKHKMAKRVQGLIVEVKVGVESNALLEMQMPPFHRQQVSLHTGRVQQKQGASQAPNSVA